MKEKIEKYEKWILRNLSIISFVIIVLISIIQIYFYFIWKIFLEIKDFIALLWAIFVFWYWYKTYERNKELEIIEKYTSEYDNIFNNIRKEKNKYNYNKLLNLWYKEFYLYHQWYINSKLWNEWDIWIKNDINDYLKVLFNDLPKDWITEYENWYTDYNYLLEIVENLIYNDVFFLSLNEIIKYWKDTKVLNNNMQFNKFIINKLESVINEWDLFIFENPEDYNPMLSKDIHDKEIFISGILKIIRQDLKC